VTAQLPEAYQYLYLPRLVGPEVLVTAMRDGVALLTWQSDTFAVQLVKRRANVCKLEGHSEV
jgi:hypothetical protein